MAPSAAVVDAEIGREGQPDFLPKPHTSGGEAPRELRTVHMAGAAVERSHSEMRQPLCSRPAPLPSLAVNLGAQEALAVAMSTAGSWMLQSSASILAWPASKVHIQTLPGSSWPLGGTQVQPSSQCDAAPCSYHPIWPSSHMSSCRAGSRSGIRDRKMRPPCAGRRDSA